MFRAAEPSMMDGSPCACEYRASAIDRVYFIPVDGDKLMMESPGVIVPMTGALSIVEIELVKAA
jgi:hypothetical protein